MRSGCARRSAVVALGAVVVLSGCSGSEPKAGRVTDSSSRSTSASPSPQPTAPEQQIEAAVRAYYAELTRAARTNDPSRLTAMTTKACPCYAAVGVIKKNVRQGETTPDAAFAVADVKVHDVSGKTGGAEVRTQDSGYDVFRGDRVVDHIEATQTHLDLSLVQDGSGRWVISNEVNLGG